MTFIAITGRQELGLTESDRGQGSRGDGRKLHKRRGWP